MKHKMRIWSLRDLVVRCECGGWEIVQPTRDQDDSEELHHIAVRAFRGHVARSRTDIVGAVVVTP